MSAAEWSWVWKVAIGVGIAYVAFCFLLYFTQRSLIYFPPGRAARGVELERLAVEGATLAIAVRPHSGPRALVYFGGNAEDLAWSLPELAASFPEHALFLPYYRGYGESEGKPTESALHADALALFDRVASAHSEIVLVGRSLGSGVAVRLASRRPIARLVLVTPFDSLLAIAGRQFPIFPVDWLLRDRFESWRHAPEIHAPTLLLAADRDAIVPVERVEALARAFPPGRATLRVIADADHDSIDWIPACRAWLQERR